MRFDLPMVNVSAVAAKSDLKVFKEVLAGRGGEGHQRQSLRDFSRKEMEDLTAYVGKYGAKGMAWFKVKDGKLDSNITKISTRKSRKKCFKP